MQFFQQSDIDKRFTLSIRKQMCGVGRFYAYYVSLMYLYFRNYQKYSVVIFNIHIVNNSDKDKSNL